MAIKTYRITCQCDLMAERILTMDVKANTERKAKIFAEEKWKKEGHFNIWIRSVELLNHTIVCKGNCPVCGKN